MLPAPAHGGPRDAHLLCCISLCFGPYSVEVQLRPSYRRRAGVLPPPAACSARRADCALRFLVHCGFGRSPPTGGVLAPSATRAMPICISHHLRTQGMKPPAVSLLLPGRAAVPACVAFAREAVPASWRVRRGRASLGCEYVAAARRIRRSCKWETQYFFFI